MRSRSNGGVIGAYALPSQNFANGVFFIHDAAIYNTGASPIWPLGTGYIYSASGGTIAAATDNGNYKTHTFTANGTFTITTGSGYIEVLLVGAGGSGGYANGNAAKGGGGAGGMVTLVTDVYVNGPTTFTVEVGTGGSALTNLNYTTPSVGAGKQSKVTSSSGYSFVTHGGGPGESINAGTKYALNSSTVSGGGAAVSYAQGANTIVQPAYTRTSFGTASSGTATNYSAQSGGGSWYSLGGSDAGNGGGGAGYTTGYDGSQQTNAGYGGDGYFWSRTNSYYGAGGGGGMTYSFPYGTTRSPLTYSKTGLYGISPGTRSNSGGWSYDWSTSGTVIDGQTNGVNYGVGGGGGGTLGNFGATGAAGSSGVVIFCYRYK